MTRGGSRPGAGRPRKRRRALNSTGGNEQNPAPVADESGAEEEELDVVDMEDAGRPQEGVFNVYYPWDEDAEAQRSVLGFEEPLPLPRCGRCGGENHQRPASPREPYTMAIRSCKFCGTVLIGKEKMGMCCGKSRPAAKGICFHRSILDPELRAVYTKRTFRNYSMQINKLFAFVHPSAELRYAESRGPSFLSVQGVDYINIPLPNARASYLWCEGPPNLSAQASFMQRAIQNSSVRQYVPVIYAKLQPHAVVNKIQYRQSLGLPEQIQPQSLGNEAGETSHVLPSTDAQGRVEQEIGVGPVEDAVGRSLTEAVTIPPAGLQYTEPSMFEVRPSQGAAQASNGPGSPQQLLV